MPHLPAAPECECYAPPLCVTRVPGERDRFYVRSEERGKKQVRYLVDLGDLDFPRGRCNCTHFECRIEPRIARGLEPPEWQCKHIRRVRTQIELCETICEAFGEDLSLAPLRIPDIHEYERSNPHGHRGRHDLQTPRLKVLVRPVHRERPALREEHGSTDDHRGTGGAPALPAPGRAQGRPAPGRPYRLFR